MAQQEDEPSGAPKSRKSPTGASRGRGEHMSEQERAESQAHFLLTFRNTANVRESCNAAGVDRKTVERWRRSKPFETRYQAALLDAADRVRAEAWRRALEGVEEPLTSGGQLVYEQVEVLDERGEVVTDRYGRPKYKRGPRVTVRKYDSAILARLMQAHLPEHKPAPVQGKVEVENADGSSVRVLFVMPEQDTLGE